MCVSHLASLPPPPLSTRPQPLPDRCGLSAPGPTPGPARPVCGMRGASVRVGRGEGRGVGQGGVHAGGDCVRGPTTPARSARPAPPVYCVRSHTPGTRPPCPCVEGDFYPCLLYMKEGFPFRPCLPPMREGFCASYSPRSMKEVFVPVPLMREGVCASYSPRSIKEVFARALCASPTRQKEELCSLHARSVEDSIAAPLPLR